MSTSGQAHVVCSMMRSAEHVRRYPVAVLIEKGGGDLIPAPLVGWLSTLQPQSTA